MKANIGDLIMIEMSVDNRTQELEFSTQSARTLRKVLEIGGWLMMVALILPGSAQFLAVAIF